LHGQRRLGLSLDGGAWRNALRRVVVFGIVGGVVFIAALIAFVLRAEEMRREKRWPWRPQIEAKK